MSAESEQKRVRRLPRWMKMPMPRGENYSKVKNIVNKHHLHTICTSGNCPNIAECWNRGTATFMILGDICTRSCKFCGVKTGKPNVVDMREPEQVANSVKLMNLTHCVLTSVDRDDLEDGGAFIWAETIKQVKKAVPGITIEVLIPDFRGVEKNIRQVLDANPDVVSHNMETVERLTPQIRSVAKYKTSLDVLEYISKEGYTAKSGIMVGLGETQDEIYQTMDDLLKVNCNIITIGQYLQPTFEHLPVERFVTPEEFSEYKETGLQKGFKHIESSPLVRSSYFAEKHVF